MTQEGQTRGMRPWLKVVLFASLAMNLAVVGLVGGMALRGGPAPYRDGGRPDAVAPYTRAFSDGQRKDLRQALRQAYGAHPKERRRDPVADYSAALEVIRATPFNPDHLREVLEQQGSQAELRRSHGQDVLAQYIADLSDEDRQVYADRLEDQISRFAERREKWRKK